MNSKDKITTEGILFTDQYQLTMAQLYFKLGLHEKLAQFDHYFRSYPVYNTYKSGYCISAGLEWLISWMKNSKFRETDINILKCQKDKDGKNIFDKDFLKWLKQNGNFDSLTIHSIPEGRVVHPNIPLTIVQGPLAIAQLLESSLLNHLNYQTLIATKAARIKESSRGQMLLEFGMRRGQDKGANAGARAALIGGADFSSNVGLSHVLGFSPIGTHAHSMVQVFLALGGSELDAFRAYANLYPDNCLLLVDTINTLESGIPNAIKVFQELKNKGYKPIGIRLDSGDLAFLSIQAAKMLDQEGFKETVIVVSNNLDEMIIWQIITQIIEEAPKYGVDPDNLIKRLVYGVGTRLITSHGEPALGGVYKLVALKDNMKWQPAIKISETPDKTPNPGKKSLWRIYDKRNKATSDLISLEDEDPRKMKKLTLRHPSDHTQYRILNGKEISKIEPLLKKILEKGKLTYQFPEIKDIRKTRIIDMNSLDTGVKRIMNPHIYHVSLTDKIWKLKQSLITSVNSDINPS